MIKKNLLFIFIFAASLWIDQYGGTIWHGGKYIMTEPGPFVYEGTMMIPFKPVVEELLNGTVEWNPQNRKVSARINGQDMQFSIDANDVLIVDGRLYVPIHYIDNK